MASSAESCRLSGKSWKVSSHRPHPATRQTEGLVSHPPSPPPTALSLFPGGGQEGLKNSPKAIHLPAVEKKRALVLPLPVKSASGICTLPPVLARRLLVPFKLLQNLAREFLLSVEF